MVKPYELYVRFLVTKGFEEPKEVNEHLAELNLKPVTQDEWDRQYNLVHDTVPDPISRQILDERYEGEFLRWMKVLEVHDLWMVEKKFRTDLTRHLRLVYDIHDDPKLRMSLNAMLMKGVSHREMCQSLNVKFSYMLKEDVVDLYQRFFWDPRRMTRKDWKSYLGLCTDHEQNVLFTVLTESVDVVKTMLDLPSKANVSDALQYLLTTSYQKAKHYLRLNTKESNAEARAWISQTIALADKYEKHRTGDVEDFAKTLQMEFEFVESEFPTPDQATLQELRNAQKGTAPAAADTKDPTGGGAG